EGRALGPWRAFQVVGHVGDRGARVARRRRRAQVVVVAGDVDEKRRGRGDDRVRVLAGRAAPGGQGYARAVDRETVHEDVRVADEARQAVGGDVDAATERMQVVDDVASDDVSAERVLD